MKNTILTLLLSNFTGMRKDGLAQLARVLSLQATTEEEAKALVEKLSETQVKDFIKDYRSEIDKEISEANKTFETNLKKKFKLVEVEKEPGKPGNETPPEPGDISSIIQDAVAKAVQPLQEKIQGFESQKITQTRLQSLEGALKGVPGTYKAKILKDFGKMNFESEQAFDEYLEETQNDVADFTQELANQGMGQQGKPIFGQPNQSGVSPSVAQFIEGKKGGETSLAGKEI